jgi:sugar lactone lactonase YvrE
VTVAGGYQGNHKPALSASFAYPTSVAFDAAGNLYIADSDNCEIRKINKQGVVEVVAGTGVCGFGGDGGRASSAMLGNIVSIVFDQGGNLLFADANRIRKITAGGIISTIVGNGSFGYSGDGGPATQAQLGARRGISLDAAGDLYIADSNNFVVRKVNSAGTISTVAGDPSAPYAYLGEGGPATSANLGYVQSVAADGTGNIYLTDGYEHVRQVDTAGLITTIAGSGQGGNTGDGGPATAAAIGSGQGLLLNGNALYLSTSTSIWWIDLSGGLIHLVGGGGVVAGFGGDGGPASAATFNLPLGMAFDSQGNLVVADTANGRIREITLGSQVVTTIAGGYVGDGHKAPDACVNFSSFGNHITFDNAGNLYIADTGNNRVRKVSPKGTITTLAGIGTSGYSGDGGPATSAQLAAPTAVGADPFGNIFILDNGTGVVRKVDNPGTISTLRPNGIPFFGQYVFDQGLGLAIDSAGNVYFPDGFTVIWKVDTAGNATVVAGQLWFFNESGDGGPATQAGLFFPQSVTVDAMGNLYIAEWLSHRVRKVDTAGIITTVAGNGTPGFSGDGGPATAANLNFPQDVTTDAAGNLYIADWINFRIRMVDGAGIIQTVVGSGGFGFTGERIAPKQVNVFPVGLAVSPAGDLTFADESMFRVRKVVK